MTNDRAKRGIDIRQHPLRLAERIGEEDARASGGESTCTEAPGKRGPLRPSDERRNVGERRLRGRDQLVDLGVRPGREVEVFAGMFLRAAQRL